MKDNLSDNMRNSNQNQGLNSSSQDSTLLSSTDTYQNKQYCDKENIPKKSNPLDEYNDQFRKCKQKNDSLLRNQTSEQLGKEKTCQCSQQMVKLRKQFALEMKSTASEYEQKMVEMQSVISPQQFNLKAYQEVIHNMKSKYELELQNRGEELENAHLLMNHEPNNFEFVIENLKKEFDNELKNEKFIFQTQLEVHINEKVKIEQLLRNKTKEVKVLLDQVKELQMKPITNFESSRSISSNMAPLLYRDTNRKKKITLENDLSIVEDDIFMGFHSSIKNFNDRVKLIDKSIEHSILK